jgi:hypothetical protein
MITISSSQGDFRCNEDGKISTNGKTEYETGNGELIQILSFDTEEWKSHYQHESLPLSIDILDLGYTYQEKDASHVGYEPPDYEWRELMRQLQVA